MVAANMLFNSAEWRAALGAPLTQINSSVAPTQSWRRAVSRHLRLAALVGDVAVEGNRSEVRRQERKEAGAAAAVAAPVQGGDCLLGRKQNSNAPPHPLHCAASQGMLEAGAALIAMHNTVAVRDSSGRSALHWASMVGQLAFASMLIDYKNNMLPVIAKVKSTASGDAATLPTPCSADSTESLIEARDNAGRTPLMYACAFGALPLVKLLLDKGADRNSRDFRGLTPLHAAAAGGHVEVARILLLAGADHLLAAHVGATPRHVAQRQGHVDMVRLLVKHDERSKRHARRDSGRELYHYRQSHAQEVDLRSRILTRVGSTM